MAVKVQLSTIEIFWKGLKLEGGQGDGAILPRGIEQVPRKKKTETKQESERNSSDPRRSNPRKRQA